MFLALVGKLLYNFAMKIGVLDIQGSVEEHFASLKKLGLSRDCPGTESGLRFGKGSPGTVPGLKGVEAVLVKKVSDLEGVCGLIIPGGESTTIGKLLRRFGLDLEIKKRFKSGRLAIWGTCAGAILIAKEIVGRETADSLQLMDITVERNAYGRQIDSFETTVMFDGIGEIPAVFIRAPKIVRVGKGVRVLSKYEGEIVAARSGKLLATTFHPEMTEDARVHEYFKGMC